MFAEETRPELRPGSRSLIRLPVHEPAKGGWVRREGVPAARQVGAQLVQDEHAGPAVHHQVVGRPQHAEPGGPRLNRMHPHQRRTCEREAPPALRVLQGTEACFLPFRVEVAPVVFRPGQGHRAPHRLQRCLQTLPDEGRAQRGVPGQHGLPCLPESGRVRHAVQVAGDLDHVDAGVRLRDRVVEHPGLGAGQRIEILDVVHGRQSSASARRSRSRARLLCSGSTSFLRAGSTVLRGSAARPWSRWRASSATV